MPKFISCLQTNCPAVYAIASPCVNCPSSTDAPTTVVEIMTMAIHSSSGQDTVTVTTTDSVTEMNTTLLTTTTTAVGHTTVTGGGNGTFVTTVPMSTGFIPITTDSTSITSPITTVLGTFTIVNSSYPS